jgi:hypothetical protein
MATTTLKVEQPGQDPVRVKFMTTYIEAPAKDGSGTKVFLDVEVYVCDEEFVPQGRTSKTVQDRSEEDYHKDLRAQAAEKGHFVPEESTNPEWNPVIDLDENGEDRDSAAI